MELFLTYEDFLLEKIKNPGLLEVPDGKKVTDMPVSHFVALAKTKGKDKIIRGLLNLYSWNIKKNKTLSDWAKDMKEKVSKELDKV